MPKIVDHAEYRQKLVEGCIELFAQRGYGALTMRDVASALSVSTGTLYHYFPSKEALFDAAVRRVTEQDLGAAETLAALDVSPRERLDLLFAFFTANEQRFAQYLMVLMEFRRVHGPESAAYAAVEESGERYVATIARFLNVPAEAARLVFMLGNGVVIKRLFDRGATRLEDYADLVARLLPEARPSAARKRRAR